jgi:hypothetical protein
MYHYYLKVAPCNQNDTINIKLGGMGEKPPCERKTTNPKIAQNRALYQTDGHHQTNLNRRSGTKTTGRYLLVAAKSQQL